MLDGNTRKVRITCDEDRRECVCLMDPVVANWLGLILSKNWHPHLWEPDQWPVEAFYPGILWLSQRLLEIEINPVREQISLLHKIQLKIHFQQFVSFHNMQM